MMQFNDIKAFVELAANPEKYKQILDDFEQREQRFKDLLAEVTEAQTAKQYLEKVMNDVSVLESKAQETKQSIAKSLEQFHLDKQEREAKLIKRENVVTKQELELDAALKEYKQKLEQVEELKQEQLRTLESAKILEQRATDLQQEYQEKLDKLNAILK